MKRIQYPTFDNYAVDSYHIVTQFVSFYTVIIIIITIIISSHLYLPI